MKKMNRGMTLIELVVAMAVFGILTLMVFSFFNFGLRGFETSKDMSDEQFQVRFAAGQISEILRNVATFDLPASPPTLAAGEFAIYVAAGQLILEDDVGDTRPLSSARIGSVAFTVIEGDNLMLGFVLTSDEGYTVSSQVLLNNYGDYVDGNHTYSGALAGDYILFTNP